MRSLLSLLVASTLLAGLSPIPGAQDGQDPKPPLSKSAKAARKFQARMEGAWKLVDMQLVAEDAHGFGNRRLQQVGYALIHGGYLSIEFHMRLVDKEEQDWGQSLVTGLHRFEVDETGSMETTTVIATRTRRDGSPDFEPPGTKRRYVVALEGEKLTMTRDDGHRLEFEPLHDDRRRLDAFGRQLRDQDDVESPETGKDGGGTGGERKKD